MDDEEDDEEEEENPVVATFGESFALLDFKSKSSRSSTRISSSPIDTLVLFASACAVFAAVLPRPPWLLPLPPPRPREAPPPRPFSPPFLLPEPWSRPPIRAVCLCTPLNEGVTRRSVRDGH